MIALLLLVASFSALVNSQKFTSHFVYPIPIVNQYADRCASQSNNLPVDPNTSIDIYIMLKQRNLKELERQIYSASDPFDDNYQNFLSRDDVISLISPTKEDRESVMKFFSEITKPSTLVDHGDSIQVSLSADTARQLGFYEYTSSEHLSLIEVPCHIRSLQTSSEVASVIDFISPHLQINQPINQHQSLNVRDDPKFMFVPQSVWSLYGMPITNSTAPSPIKVGHYAHFPSSFQPQNIHLFEQNTTINMPSTFHGGSFPSGASIFPLLDFDVQVASGIHPSSDVWLYNFTDPGPDPLKILMQFNQLDDLPHILVLPALSSFSEKSADPQYVARFDTELQKLAARGVTLIATTGQSGSHPGDPKCSDNATHVTLPAASPWVVAVGSTTFTNLVAFDGSVAPACSSSSWSCVETGDEEVVLNSTTKVSGGGFSAFFTQPLYQQDAVNKFLASKSGLPEHSYVPTQGRAVPDISVLGIDAFISATDSNQPPTLTNAAALVATGIIASLTEKYFELTGNTFGFINPLLYRLAQYYPSVYNDIVQGGNRCVASTDGCVDQCEGFTAVPGFDAVSGLGSINYDAFVSAIEQMMYKGQIKRRKTKVASF